MQSSAKTIYEFDTFRIDTQERQLSQNGHVVPLSGKVFEILLTLVENRGRTVRKDELMEKVWSDSFVEEGNLTRNISTLRKVLGDDFHKPRFIKTVPKLGYRFENDVRKALEETDELVIEKRTRYNITLSASAGNPANPYFRRVATLLIALAFVGSVFAVAIRWTTSNETRVANAEAVELYERGRELWENRSAAGLHEATILLERAVAADPDFALAHAALADAYAFDVGKWKMAEAAANRAIELDPNLGEPYASIGFVKFFWEWKPSEAEQNFKKAVQLSPNYATAHQWFAVRLLSNGQFNQALAEINRAHELEPDSIAVNADLCQTFYFLERYDEAEAQCKKTLEMDANSFNAITSLYLIYVAKGMYPQAVDAFFRRENLSVNHSTLPRDLEDLRAAFERGGIRSFWRTHTAALKRPPLNSAYTIAQNYALLGNPDEAMRHLQLAYETREFGFPLFPAEPVFRNCCLTDPRYAELRRLLEKGKV